MNLTFGQIDPIPAFQVNNTERFDQFLEKNDHPSNRPTLSFLARWAYVMEEKIHQGNRLEDIIDEARSEVAPDFVPKDTLDNAIKILITYWARGEELRKWHVATHPETTYEFP